MLKNVRLSIIATLMGWNLPKRPRARCLPLMFGSFWRSATIDGDSVGQSLLRVGDIFRAKDSLSMDDIGIYDGDLSS
jgi:hypothetical protein